MAMKLLSTFKAKYPALAKVPFIVIEGKPFSPAELIEKPAVTLNMLDIRWLTEESIWILTEEHYRRLIATSIRRPLIISINGVTMTYEEALEHVEKKTDKGKEIVESYKDLLREVYRRLTFG